MNIKEYLEQKRSKEPLTGKEEELYRELCRREKGIK
jgi:hypothetical protein